MCEFMLPYSRFFETKLWSYYQSDEISRSPICFLKIFRLSAKSNALICFWKWIISKVTVTSVITCLWTLVDKVQKSIQCPYYFPFDAIIWLPLPAKFRNHVTSTSVSSSKSVHLKQISKFELTLKWLRVMATC